MRRTSLRAKRSNLIGRCSRLLRFARNDGRIGVWRERLPACILPLAFLALAAAASAQDGPGQVRDAIQEAYREDALYENALYLYLRMAAVVWVAVEWIAAVVLWRAYRLLRKAAKARGLVS